MWKRLRVHERILWESCEPYSLCCVFHFTISCCFLLCLNFFDTWHMGDTWMCAAEIFPDPRVNIGTLSEGVVQSTAMRRISQSVQPCWVGWPYSAERLDDTVLLSNCCHSITQRQTLFHIVLWLKKINELPESLVFHVNLFFSFHCAILSVVRHSGEVPDWSEFFLYVRLDRRKNYRKWQAIREWNPLFLSWINCKMPSLRWGCKCHLTYPKLL